MEEFKIIILTTIMITNLSAFADVGLAKTKKSEGEATKSVSRKLMQAILGTKPLIPDDVKENIRFRVDNDYSVGIVVGIVSPKGTEYYGYGKTAFGCNQDVDENTLFEIGSITKVFTALLWADMVETKELFFDDTIEKYLPDSVSVPKRKNQSIKLLNLVMQSAGLPYLPDNINLTTNPDNPLESYTVEQMYDFLSSCKLKYDIGTQCGYSNYGHALLGHILSLLNGTTYEDLVKERITSELGMTDTIVEPTAEMQKRLARGHVGVIEIPDFKLAATFAGSGSLHSTAGDIVKFLEACLELKSVRLEPAFKTIYELLKEPPGTYEKPAGAVWSLQTIAGQPIRWFEGITVGQHSFIGFIREEQKGVVVLSNTREDIKDIGFHLLNANLPLLVLPVPAKIPSQTLESYAGKYKLDSEKINVLFQNGYLVLVKKWNQVPLKCMLYAKSESEFWNPTFDIKVMFQTNDKGEVISLSLYEQGQSKGQIARKVKDNVAKSAEAKLPGCEKSIKANRLKEDLDFLFKTIEEVHPSMYAYTSKEEFEPHTIILPPPNEFKDYVNAGGKVFPLSLGLEGLNIVLAENHIQLGVPIGGTVLTINQEPAFEVLKGLARGFATEGMETKNTCNILRAIRPKVLRFLMWFEYGPLESWEIRTRTNDGKVSNHTIESLAIPKIEGDWLSVFKRENSYHYIPEYGAALLEINSFSSDIQEFKKFLAESFEKIAVQNVPNLIIDVRKNAGGSSSFGDVLLDYLTNQPFRQYERGVQKISKQACGEDLEKIRASFSDKSINFGSMVTGEAPFQEPSNNPLRFEGRVYVLISQVTYSAAMDFTSAIKCFNVATLVGQETCDTPVSYGAILPFNLPNSNLFLLVPTKYFVGACGKPDGHGVIPDYEVKQKPEDTAKGVDTVLQFTLDLIKKSTFLYGSSLTSSKMLKAWQVRLTSSFNSSV